MKTSAYAIAVGTVLALGLIAGTAPVASAQDASLSPNFGSVKLRSGFTPDPYTVDVTGGGSIDAYEDTDLPGECTGNISDAPDFSVTYTAGNLPLVFRTVSTGDTTLIVNGPDGGWSCDDDSFGDNDAQVVFRRPASGKYDVWVGVLGRSTAETTLAITETP